MKAKVTVFMPVYNAEKYLKQSIDSILNQTYKNFELLIIDDGSTDSSLEIINSYEDKRIILYRNEENKGLPYTRNKGLDLARGEFIALMDADDISKPNRLEIQVDFLENNKEYGAVSSRVERLIGEKKYKPFIRLHKFRCVNIQLMFNNVMGNPAAMFRRSIIEDYKIKYRNECFVGQDYAFWIDCARYTKLALISKPLLVYRTGHDNITKKSMDRKSSIRKEVLDNVRIMCLKNNGVNLDNGEYKLFNKIFSDPQMEIDSNDIEQYKMLMKKIIESNTKFKKSVLANEMKNALAERILRMNCSKHYKIKLINFRLKHEKLKSYMMAILKIIII